MLSLGVGIGGSWISRREEDGVGMFETQGFGSLALSLKRKHLENKYLEVAC